MWSDRIVRDQVASPPSSLFPNLGMMRTESLHLCLLCFFSLLLFFLHCKGVLRSVLISLCAFAHCSQHDSEKWFVSLDLFAGRHKAKRHNIWRQSKKPRLRGFLACAPGCCLCSASRFISALPPSFFSLLDSFARSSHPPQRCWEATAGPGGAFFGCPILQ